MIVRTLALVVMIVLLTNCGSSPKTNFFMLTVIPDRNQGYATISSPLQLTAVHIPPGLDRREMVRMTGGNRVDVSDVDRWSAPIDQMVRNVLSEDLSARFPAGSVILPDAPAPPGTRRLVVTIAQFGPDANANVQLQGSWVLLSAAAETPIVARDFHLDAGPAITADATARGMSQALGELATQIASNLSAGHAAAQ